MAESNPTGKTPQPRPLALRRTSAEIQGGQNSRRENQLALDDPRALENPLLLLPPGGVCAAVGRLWMANSHFFAGSLSLATTFRVYQDEQGLTDADLVEVCRMLLTPERRSRHRYVSDLMTDLSALVVESIRRRRVEEVRQARWQNHAKEVEQAVTPDEVRRLLDSLPRVEGGVS